MYVATACIVIIINLIACHNQKIAENTVANQQSTGLFFFATFHFSELMQQKRTEP